jgi:hypothetical protein
MTSNTSEDDFAQQWYEQKSRLIEASLGVEHKMVMHAIVPYEVGGALDLYYYAKGLPGTAIATKELSELPNEGSSNDVYRSYELMMFAKHPLDLDTAYDNKTAFGRAHTNINAILNLTGRPAGVLIGFESEDDWFDYRLEHHTPRVPPPDRRRACGPPKRTWHPVGAPRLTQRPALRQRVDH